MLCNNVKDCSDGSDELCSSGGNNGICYNTIPLILYTYYHKGSFPLIAKPTRKLTASNCISLKSTVKLCDG